MACRNGCGIEWLVTDHGRGEVVCSNCGLVLEQLIDFTNGKKAYNKEEVLNRVHHGLLHRSGTTMLPVDGSPQFVSKFKNLQRYQNNSNLKQLKRLKFFNHIQTAGSQLELSDLVIKNSFSLVELLINKDLKGSSIQGLSYAILYLSARLSNQSRPLEYFEKELGFEKLKSSYLKLTELLSDKIEIPSENFLDYIQWVFNNVNEKTKLSQKVLINSLKLGYQIKSFEDFYQGFKPVGFAGAIIYVIANALREPVTQEIVGEASYTTPNSIRKYVKFLNMYIKIK